MLKIWAIKTPSDREEIIRKRVLASPTNRFAWPITWVSSSLASSERCVQRFRTENETWSEDGALASQDFWQKIFAQNFPEFRILNSEVTEVMVKEYLRDQEVPWLKTSGAVRKLVEYLHYFMPVLSHESGYSTLLQWFQERPQSFERWGVWFVAAEQIWRYFSEEKYIDRNWIVSYLSNNSDDKSFSWWKRPLVWDTGARVETCETELLAKLSEFVDVDVLVPILESGEVPYGYRTLCEKNKINESDSLCHSSIKTLKVTTNLAEVKMVVGQARRWLDDGVPAEEIALIAPKLETYMPALESYLIEEGIPFQNDFRESLICFSSIQQWLSRLMVETGEVTTARLESALYGSQNFSQIPYQRFKRLFSSIYSEEDLSRSDRVQQYLTAAKSEDPRLACQEAVAWSLTKWPDGTEEEFRLVERILKKLVEGVPRHVRLLRSDWARILESIARRETLVLRARQTRGVQILDLSESSSAKLTRTCVFGLSQDALRSSDPVGVLEGEILSIQAQTGFFLSSSRNAPEEFEARYLSNSMNGILLCSAADFEGDPVLPSAFWLSARVKEHSSDWDKLDIPLMNRWDEIQRVPISKIADVRGWDVDRARNILSRVEADRAAQTFFAVREGEILPKVESLSASLIEDYLQCPFILFAKKLMKLSDLPSLDLDLDRATKGRLIHALLERLMVEPVRFDRSEEEISEVLEQVRKDLELEMGDSRLWPMMKKRHIQIAMAVLRSEKQWRADFPDTRIAARELKFQGFLNEETGELSSQKMGIPFRGAIDRVDVNAEGVAIVLDYKSSSFGLKSPNNWIESGELQMLLYAEALENNLTDLKVREVAGGFYYVLRDAQKKRGFRLKEYMDELYPIVKGKYSGAIDREEKSELFESAHDLLRKSLQSLKQGRLGPEPRNVDDCKQCQWRCVCRAPHLNT